MRSYPKIYNLGHKYLEHLFDDIVIIEEKVDGSQFTFGKTTEGQVFYHSKGRELFQPVTDKLFKAACDYVDSIADKLEPGVTYRGEVLAKPKHNTLAYDRTPKHNIILFDIDVTEENYMSVQGKKGLAEKLDLEVVPLLGGGRITEIGQLKSLLATPSILGGCNVEGIVIKNYHRFGIDGKALMGKWVREEFKEMNGGEWKKNNPTALDFVSEIINTYKSPARWEKAVQHLRDAGKLLGEPKDIGPLIGEVIDDVKTECAEEIKEKLFQYYWPKIARGLTGGLPDWYKEKVAITHFAEGGNNE